ncbi:MAG: STAS-like domain-containing protein [Acidobacteriota bacterium]|nr:STAS-like domain-containing protein [Acidobacteriota bacterium]
MTRRIIGVPNSLNDKALPQFFKGWDWNLDPPEEVVIDFSQVSFTAPWALTLFAAYAVWLREVRERAVSVWIDETSEAGWFLAQSGLRRLLGADDTSRPEVRPGRFMPLVRISSSAQIPSYVDSVMKVLAIDDEEMAGAVQYSIVELLRNVVQHSRSRIGGIAYTTYFPSTGLVEFVVADVGCGIQASLRSRYPEIINDFGGVRWAVQPHVSGTFAAGAYQSMANNAGLGLFFIKEIVSRGCGSFFLGSGTMLADFWGNADGSPGKQYVESRTGGWRGTFALVQLRRDRIHEFGALLQRCREIAAAARRDPSELKLDFVDAVPDVEGLRVIAVKPFEENVERAAEIRESEIMPALVAGALVVLDFSGIRFATQSFIHACMYRILRDASAEATNQLSIANATPATREAIRAVAAYATVDGPQLIEGRSGLTR